MNLTGLRPENPVAAMAAYGALRLLPGAQLRWDGPHPELRWEGDSIRALAAQLPERLTAPELQALDDPREKNIGGVEGYRQLAEQVPHAWLTALAAETAGGIAHTCLLLFGGGHKFVRAARDLMTSLVKLDIEDRVREALVGPWRYDCKAQAWGWDAAARDDSAALAGNPSAKDKTGVPGAYWLAWESLPAWQIVAGRTLGHDPKGHTWAYPTSAEWLSWDGLKALAAGWERMPERELTALGVRIWRAPILPSGTMGKELGLARGSSGGRDSKQRNSRARRLPFGARA